MGYLKDQWTRSAQPEPEPTPDNQPVVAILVLEEPEREASSNDQRLTGNTGFVIRPPENAPERHNLAPRGIDQPNGPSLGGSQVRGPVLPDLAGGSRSTSNEEDRRKASREAVKQLTKDFFRKKDTGDISNETKISSESGSATYKSRFLAKTDFDYASLKGYLSVNFNDKSRKR